MAALFPHERVENLKAHARDLSTALVDAEKRGWNAAIVAASLACNSRKIEGNDEFTSGYRLGCNESAINVEKLHRR